MGQIQANLPPKQTHHTYIQQDIILTILSGNEIDYLYWRLLETKESNFFCLTCVLVSVNVADDPTKR